MLRIFFLDASECSLNLFFKNQVEQNRKGSLEEYLSKVFRIFSAFMKYDNFYLFEYL